MAKTQNQKQKLLVLWKIFHEETDQQHPLTIAELIDRLASHGISAERKSLYADMETLRLFGVEIIPLRTKTVAYYLGERSFSLAELKLLVDVVQSSKFITQKKSLELIGKLEKLASVHEARLLRRQVFVAGRVKTMNESIYYNTDAIHTAIADNRQISFRYYTYTVTKEQNFRRNGERYQVSPQALSWADENYYLIAYDQKAGKVKHFRVDKMVQIQVEGEEREEAAALDLAAYAGKSFSMYGGAEKLVTLWLANEMAGVVIDRFGKDIAIRAHDGESFTVQVPVFVSPQFFGWLAGLGGKAAVAAPPDVQEAYRAHLLAALARAEERNGA